MSCGSHSKASTLICSNCEKAEQYHTAGLPPVLNMLFKCSSALHPGPAANYMYMICLKIKITTGDYTGSLKAAKTRKHENATYFPFDGIVDHVQITARLQTTQHYTCILKARVRYVSLSMKQNNSMLIS